MQKEFDTINGTAATFGISVSTVYNLLGEGVILGRKLGKRLLVDQTSAREYFNALPPATSSIRPSKEVARRAARKAAALSGDAA
jgi:hypothetical protein